MIRDGMDLEEIKRDHEILHSCNNTKPDCVACWLIAQLEAAQRGELDIYDPSNDVMNPGWKFQLEAQENLTNELAADLATLHRENERLKADRDMWLSDDAKQNNAVGRLTKERDELRQQLAQARAGLRAALKLPRPWLRPAITFEEWEAAFQQIEVALEAKK